MEIRPYRPEDAPACLAVFDSNTPQFFMPSERDEFAAFLAEPGGTYLVGVVDGLLVACGGYWPLPDAPVAALTWGMVHRDHHRRGLGRQLLEHRLVALREHPELAGGSATIARNRQRRHSQEAEGRRFYERARFPE